MMEREDLAKMEREDLAMKILLYPEVWVIFQSFLKILEVKYFL